MNNFFACLMVTLSLAAGTASADDAAATKTAVERFIAATNAEKHTEARVRKYVAEIRLNYIESWGRGGERLDRVMALDKFEASANRAVDPAALTRDYMNPVLTKYFTAAEITALADNVANKTDPGDKYRGLAQKISRETLEILQKRVDEAAAAAAKEASLDPPVKIYKPA